MSTAITDLGGRLDTAEGSIQDLSGLFLGVITPLSSTKASVTVDITNPDADLTYTAVAYGEIGNILSVVHVNNGVSQLLDIAIVNSVITVSLATDEAGVVTTVANDIVTKITTTPELASDITCTAEGTGLGIVNDTVSAPLVGGTNATPEAAVNSLGINADGTKLYIKISEHIWSESNLANI